MKTLRRKKKKKEQKGKERKAGRRIGLADYKINYGEH
jgi:hypothetical protein